MSNKPIVIAAVLLSGAAFGSGLDRDGMLTEAPATPDSGTVRVTAGGGNERLSDGSAQAQLTGSLMWTPVEHLAGDVGAYFQSVGSKAGPTARVRYQFLSQAGAGVDLAGGVRYKSVGFDPDRGEVELLVAAGRRIGRFDLMLDTVLGFELGQGGKDLELKGFAGYRVTDAFRAGIDSRVQFEVGDDAEASAVPAAGSDLDLTAGPAVSWMIEKTVQVQALAGIAKPRGAVNAGAVAQLFVSFDF
jgi:hypothetical protein